MRLSKLGIGRPMIALVVGAFLLTASFGGWGCSSSPSTTTGTSSPPGTTTAPSTTTQSSSVTIDLVAQNIAFNMKTITVAAGAKVTVNFNNMDSQVPHNFSVYTNSSAATSIFVGNIVTGPTKTTYTFTAPSTPGTYFFRCDVHPTSMTGTFVVTP